MRASDLVLVQGMRDTRATLAAWNLRPWQTIREWLAASAAITAALLVAVWLVAELSIPDPTPIAFPGLGREPDAAAVGFVLFRNSLVLALHALACVAGFIAGSSMPREAERYSGIWRAIHDRAGPLAIGFVICATAFSLITQAFVLGSDAATLAGHLGIGPGTLLLGLLPHALPELVALFLPLAAWTIASRRGEWHELLAATFVTVALAIPVLLLSSLVEVFVAHRLLLALAGA